MSTMLPTVGAFLSSFDEFYSSFKAGSLHDKSPVDKVTAAIQTAMAQNFFGVLGRTLELVNKKWTKVKDGVLDNEILVKCTKRVEAIRRLTVFLVEEANVKSYPHYALYCQESANRQIIEFRYDNYDDSPKAFQSIRAILLRLMQRGSQGRKTNLEADVEALFGKSWKRMKFEGAEWEGDLVRFHGTLLRYLIASNRRPQEHCEWFSRLEDDKIETIRAAMQEALKQKRKTEPFADDDLLYSTVAELSPDAAKVIRNICLDLSNWWRMYLWGPKHYVEAYVNPAPKHKLCLAKSVASSHPYLAFQFLKQEVNIWGTHVELDTLAKEIIEEVAKRSHSETALLLDSVKDCSQWFFRLCVGTYVVSLAKGTKVLLRELSQTPQNGVKVAKALEHLHDLATGIKRPEDYDYFVDLFLQELLGKSDTKLEAALGLWQQFLERYHAKPSPQYDFYLGFCLYYLFIGSPDRALLLDPALVKCYQTLSESQRKVVLDRLVRHLHDTHLQAFEEHVFALTECLESDSDRQYLLATAAMACAPVDTRLAWRFAEKIQSPTLRTEVDLEMLIPMPYSGVVEVDDDADGSVQAPKQVSEVGVTEVGIHPYQISWNKIAVGLNTALFRKVLGQIQGIAAGTIAYGKTAREALLEDEVVKKGFETMHRTLAELKDPQERIYFVDLFLQKLLYSGPASNVGGAIVGHEFLKRYKNTDEYRMYLTSLTLYLFVSSWLMPCFAPEVVHCCKQLTFSELQFVIRRLVKLLYCQSDAKEFRSKISSLSTYFLTGDDTFGPKKEANDYMLSCAAIMSLPRDVDFAWACYEGIGDYHLRTLVDAHGMRVGIREFNGFDTP